MLASQGRKIEVLPLLDSAELLGREERGQEGPASQPAVKEGEELLLIAHWRKMLRFSQSSTKL